MTLKQKATALIGLRAEMDKMRNSLKELDEKKHKIQDDIIQELKKIGYSSVKDDKTGIVIMKQVSRTLNITDEEALIDHLKKKGLTDYVKEKIDGVLWRSFSTQAIKEGLKFPGAELKETEFISIKNPK